MFVVREKLSRASAGIYCRSSNRVNERAKSYPLEEARINTYTCLTAHNPHRDLQFTRPYPRYTSVKISRACRYIRTGGVLLERTTPAEDRFRVKPGENWFGLTTVSSFEHALPLPLAYLDRPVPYGLESELMNISLMTTGCLAPRRLFFGVHTTTIAKSNATPNQITKGPSPHPYTRARRAHTIADYRTRHRIIRSALTT